MDYDQKLSPAQILNNVLTKSRPGSIIVFHDNLKAKSNLEMVLPMVLAHFAQLGYQFPVLDENCLK
jgi:hypothetical protein